MLNSIPLVLGILLMTYESVVRAFPSIDLKYSIIRKILSLLQIISNAINNTKK
jgi:hypothetical protein